MFLQGASLFALNYWLFYLSELTLTSGLAAVIFSTIVVMNMLNGVLFLKNRLELRVVAGAGLGLLGIMLVFWPEVTDFESGSENLFAAALAVLATMLASVGNIGKYCLCQKSTRRHSGCAGQYFRHDLRSIVDARISMGYRAGIYF